MTTQINVHLSKNLSSTSLSMPHCHAAVFESDRCGWHSGFSLPALLVKR
ncbi:hypothetical protein JCM19233_6401 [Vibrio astriarenae]|nr:hypothetical protein JCM19233_6401 [Vibrio sp. C7]